MSVCERVLSSWLSERISANPECAEKIGITAVMHKTNSFSHTDSTETFQSQGGKQNDPKNQKRLHCGSI